MPQKIIGFIKQHHILTLATTQGNMPHCANVFYVFWEQELRIIFASQVNTLHISHILENNSAAAGIYVQTRQVSRIQGLQMRGTVEIMDKTLNKEAHRIYLQHFPYAVFHPLTLWFFEPLWAKFTDNKLGFGVKLEWAK